MPLMGGGCWQGPLSLVHPATSSKSPKGVCGSGLEVGQEAGLG